MKKKWLLAVAICGVIAGGVFAAYSLGIFRRGNGAGKRVSSSEENAVLVDSVSAITGFGAAVKAPDRFPGKLVPQKELKVKLEQERKVKQCFVKEGDEVKEGQRLFCYDTQEDEQRRSEAELSVEKARSDVELAQKTVERMEREMSRARAEDQLAYKTEILMAQNERKRGEYEIQAGERTLQDLDRTIRDSVVTAEMAGTVQKINNPENAVGDENPYIVIQSKGEFRIQGTAVKQNENLIYEGMEMKVGSRVDPKVFWKGTVTEFDRNGEENKSGDDGFSSQEDSGNKHFYVEMEQYDGLVMGQHVYLEPYTGTQKTGLWLEESYLTEENGTWFVWKADENNLLVKQTVTVGDYDEEQMKYEVKDGLLAEDYIAFPMDGMTEGLPVVYSDLPVTGSGEDTGAMDNGVIEDPMDGGDDVVIDGDDGMDAAGGAVIGGADGGGTVIGGGTVTGIDSIVIDGENVVLGENDMVVEVP